MTKHTDNRIRPQKGPIKRTALDRKYLRAGSIGTFRIAVRYAATRAEAEQRAKEYRDKGYTSRIEYYTTMDNFNKAYGFWQVLVRKSHAKRSSSKKNPTKYDLTTKQKAEVKKAGHVSITRNGKQVRVTPSMVKSRKPHAKVEDRNKEVMIKMGWSADLKRYKGFTLDELSAAFDEAQKSPLTRFLTPADGFQDWKRPFVTTIRGGSVEDVARRVECLKVAIEYYNADKASTRWNTPGEAVVSTKGYQAW